MGEWFERVAMGSLPERAAARWGEREALVFEGARRSFAGFQEDVERAARALLAAGVEPGEKLALWLPNRPSWLHIFYGALRAGAVVVPLNTRLRARDLEYAVRQSDSATLVAADRSGPADYLSTLLEVLPELRDGPLERRPAAGFPALRRVVIDGSRGTPGTRSWRELLAEADHVPPEDAARRAAAVDPDDAALILYTSGSTGSPKGVVHGHRLVRNVTDQASRLAITPRDTTLMYLPFFHVFGLYQGALMLPLAGIRLVLQAHFQPDEALRLIEAERCTLVHGFDTHFGDLLASPRLARTDTTSLRTGILAAGMASTEPIARRVQRALCPTVSGWGMTEVGVSGTLGFLDEDEDHRCLGTGYPLPGYDFRAVDPETGRTVPPGEPGELEVRTYQMMQGYYRKPDETARAFSADGWFRSGDRVVFWPDGTMRFLGRFKEMLKVGGENVDPFEVEAFLLEHPAVAQAQVVGAPDARLAEVPVACVVPASGHTPSEDELLAHCRGRLAGFKIPRRVFVVKELPVTSSGKVQRFRLREQVAGWLAGESAAAR